MRALVTLGKHIATFYTLLTVHLGTIRVNP